MRTTRALLGTASLLAVAIVAALAAGASAQPAPPQSGDDRAVAHPGNIDIGQPGDACDALGLPGDEATMPPGTFTNDGTYIDITAFPAGSTVTGVVVKGGNAYNVYPNLGALPWLDLHSPLNESGAPAEISHWFVCLTKTTTTTTAPATTTTVGATPTTTTSAAPVVTTTTTVVHGIPGDEDLASTGFDNLWLLVSGLGLVVAGAAFLAWPKIRRRLRG